MNNTAHIIWGPRFRQLPLLLEGNVKLSFLLNNRIGYYYLIASLIVLVLKFYQRGFMGLIKDVEAVVNQKISTKTAMK